jgi:hypothetical protein
MPAAASATLAAHTMANLRNLSDIASLLLHAAEPRNRARWFMISDDGTSRPHRGSVQPDQIFGTGRKALKSRVRYFPTLLAGAFVTSFVSYLDLCSKSPTSRAMRARPCQRVVYCRTCARACRETAGVCTRLSEVPENLTAASLMVERWCNNAPHLPNAKDQAPS